MRADNNSGAFATPIVTVNDNTNWVPIGDALRMSQIENDIFIHGDIGTSPLTHFKITWAAVEGGMHTDMLADADFSSFPSAMLAFATANFWTLAAPFKIYLSTLLAVAEIQFWAKGLTTTLTLTGTVGKKI